MLCEYANKALGTPAPSPWASVSLSQKIVLRQFIPFGPEIYSENPVKHVKFPKQKDGHGVRRGVMDIYCFRYSRQEDSLAFRNIFCACTSCLEGDGSQCENATNVAPFVPCEFHEVSPDCKAEDFSHDLDDESEEESEAEAEPDLAESLSIGDYVAVIGETSAQYPVWIAKITSKVYHIVDDLEETLTKQKYLSGSRVLNALWTEYSQSHDPGVTGVYRALRVMTELPAMILSHLILTRVEVQPMKSNRGRPLQNVVTISSQEVARAASLLP